MVTGSRAALGSCVPDDDRSCRERSRTSHRALTLHHCQRCGGVWFDRAVGLAHSGSAAIDVVGGAAEGVFDAVIAIIESLFNE